MRGSTSSLAPLPGLGVGGLTKSNGDASELERFEQARLLVDRGLNQLHLLLEGDAGALMSTAKLSGVQEQQVDLMLQYIKSELGLSEHVEALKTMIESELKPALENVRQDLIMKEIESGGPERRLTNVFDHSQHQSNHRYNENDESDEFSWSNKSGGDDYTRSFDNKWSRKEINKLLNKIRSGTNVGVSHGHRRHHRRRFKSERSRRLNQVAGGQPVCADGCDQDDPDFKSCQCKELYDCVRRLKTSHYAVMFSQGLVDEETGTIENGALNDIFDANNLLQKINTIRSLERQKQCDDLLDQFHVPCKDWRNGCSASDGRSYRMVC